MRPKLCRVFSQQAAQGCFPCRLQKGLIPPPERQRAHRGCNWDPRLTWPLGWLLGGGVLALVLHCGGVRDPRGRAALAEVVL
ncbi:hypothetical protein FKM82_030451 [Ascaphus truei]